MTDKDKRLLARVDLLKLSSINKQLNSLYQKYEEIYTSLLGTGIDYSKDRVMTTPVNSLETIFCDRLCELEGRIDKLIDLKRKYLALIYKLESDAECEILIDRYVHNMSVRRISEVKKQSKSSIHRLEQKALTSYYNTNSSIITK